MAGATAAGVTASQASTITINLVGNCISLSGNNLNANLTGDGHTDLTIADAYVTSGSYLVRGSLNGIYARFYSINGVIGSSDPCN
jgi:hypothetical protein